MKTYRTQEEVPWGEITAVLYWYLEMQVEDIWRHQKRGDQRVVELSLPRLRETCENIRRLRRFLGYSGETKWEREARSLLEGETPKTQLP